MNKLEKLGKYQIKRELGRGAMGVVYEAFDPFIERTVAIKTILKSSIDKNDAEETFKRFRREAQAAGRLSHPKIVSIFEYGEDEEMAFIVMELVHGKELKEYFDHEDRFSIRDSIHIILQLLDALDYSHSRNVIHRDIKPANILITDDGQLKIADFGIAKIDSSNLTQVGVVLGTPTYMSPEQFMGHDIDHRTDIYATGVILYQFLTGERPYTGSVISIMHQAVHKDPPLPSSLNVSVSPQLDEVVRKAMAKNKADRFQSAHDFMLALKSASQILPDSSTQSGLSTLGLFQQSERDNTILLPPLTELADSTDIRRHREIETWQRITNSPSLEDFKQYLKDFPAGEFIDLARLRIASLEKIAAEKKEAAKQAGFKKEAFARAELQEKRRKEVEQQKLLEKAQLLAKEKAEAEARLQNELASKAKLAAQLMELRKKTVFIKTAAPANNVLTRPVHAKQLAESLTSRATKFSEIVTERESAISIERQLELNAKQELQEKIKRKKEAKQKLLAKRDNEDYLDVKTDVIENFNVQPKESLNSNEISNRNQELDDSQALAEVAERFKSKSEALNKQSQQSSHFWWVILAIAGVLLMAILFWMYILKP